MNRTLRSDCILIVNNTMEGITRFLLRESSESASKIHPIKAWSEMQTKQQTKTNKAISQMDDIGDQKIGQTKLNDSNLN